MFYNYIMEREDFEKLKIISDFKDFIMTKNYSNNTLISYLSDLYYFSEFSFMITDPDFNSYKNKMKEGNLKNA